MRGWADERMGKVNPPIPGTPSRVVASTEPRRAAPDPGQKVASASRQDWPVAN